MFQLPDIYANIKGDLDPLKASFDAARSLAGSSAGGIAEAFSGIGEIITSPITELLGAAAASLSAAGAFHEVRDAMREIDDIAKSADRIGITTEAFQALSCQAKLVHVDVGTLDMGFKEFQRSMADAAGGSKDAADAYAKLGLNASQLVNLAPDQAMGRVADALKEIANPTERAADAMAIFGARSGPELMNLLNQGSAGMKAARDDINAFGESLNRVDAGKVELANQSFVKIEQIMEGVSEEIAVSLSPYIQGIGDALVDAGKKGGGFGSEVGGAVEWLAKGIAKTSDYIQLLPAGFHGFRAGALEAIAGVIDGLNKLAHVSEEVLNFFGANVHFTALDDLSQGFHQVAGEEAQAMNDAMKKFNDGANFNKVTAEFDAFKKNNQEMAQSIADAHETVNGAFQKPVEKGADEALKKLQEQAEQFKKSIETPQEKLNDEVAKMQEYFDHSLITAEQFHKGVGDAIQKTAEEMTKAQDSVKHQDQFASLIKAGSNDALKLQFSLQRGADSDIPSRHLAVAQQSVKLLAELVGKMDFQEVNL